MTDMKPVPPNADRAVIEDFGTEWTRFDQSALSDEERRAIFDGYFARFPWAALPPGATGFDLGCGSGRWASLVAPRVGHLHCIDPSSAIDVARRNLSAFTNCTFHQASVDDLPLADASMDFGYSLGVLHHVPDTQAGLNACVRKLKKGAPFLVYLYYAFDNQAAWFKAVWRVSDGVRRVVASLPERPKYAASQVIAGTVYWPLARTARLLSRAGLPVHSFPLSSYRDRSFYTMRTDALDRFGTRLEQRFTKREIELMMRASGLDEITFNTTPPFWCAVGIKT
jgi:ubiquinone/menaquinone biosynthesis C-methylase UbiE